MANNRDMRQRRFVRFSLSYTVRRRPCRDYTSTENLFEKWLDDWFGIVDTGVVERVHIDAVLEDGLLVYRDVQCGLGRRNQTHWCLQSDLHDKSGQEDVIL